MGLYRIKTHILTQIDTGLIMLIRVMVGFVCVVISPVILVVYLFGYILNRFNGGSYNGDN